MCNGFYFSSTSSLPLIKLFFFFIIDSFCFLLMTGPVFLELPIDVLYSYELVVSELVKKDSGKAKGLVNGIINWYKVIKAIFFVSFL